MTRKIKRHVEELEGGGRVLKKGTKIAEVWYFISIDQEFLQPRSLQTEEAIPGHKGINGHMAVLHGERNFPLGENLPLILEDGRKLEFFARSGNPVSGNYECVNVNPNGII